VGHETLGWDEGAAWQYVLPDALGSVRQAADGTGAVTAARAWTPYGVELGGAQAGLGYAGEWWDEGLEMQYLRARWYDAKSSRFTSQDPWFGTLVRPQSLSKWTYVEGNPLRFVDPQGFRGIIPWERYYSILESSSSRDDIDIIEDLGSEVNARAEVAIRNIEFNFEGRSEILPRILFWAIPCPEFLPVPYTNYDDLFSPKDLVHYKSQPPYLNERDYNQYDWLISGWVDYWNWRALREGKPYNLDPNFIKAVAYVETVVGYMETEDDYEGILQLGSVAIAELKDGGKVSWGPINVVDVYNASHNIGGGVRWLMHKHEVESSKSWLEAYAFYSGFAGNVEVVKIQEVEDVYETGLDPYYSPDPDEDFYLFDKDLQ
jgi:RHS repeat-associated protein